MSAQPFIWSFYLKSHAASAVQNWCLRTCKNCHLWSTRRRTSKTRRMLHTLTALILLETSWQIHMDIWWEPAWGLYVDICWEPAWGSQVDIWWGSCSSCPVMFCCWESAFGKLRPPRQNASSDLVPLVPTAPSHLRANAPSCSGNAEFKASFEVLIIFYLSALMLRFSRLCGLRECGHHSRPSGTLQLKCTKIICCWGQSMLNSTSWRYTRTHQNISIKCPCCFFPLSLEGQV